MTTQRSRPRAAMPSVGDAAVGPARSMRAGLDIDGDHKLGEAVARRIESDMLVAGLPIGSVFGSQADLLERYDVSRAVFREAVRVLEHLGVARMRRGPGGGLIVAEPDPTAVFNSAIVYLTYERVRLEEVIEVRLTLETAAAQWAAAARTDTDVAELQRLLQIDESSDGADEEAFHTGLASISGNPALELFIRLLARLFVVYSSSTRLTKARTRSAVAEAQRAHRRLVDAVAEGDAEAAARRVHRHLDLGREFLTAKQLERTLGFADAIGPEGTDVRLAPQVAREIYVRIVARGWNVGELIGSEADLLAEHGVSRSVLREALRLLEFNRVVRTRRGPGGGIFIDAPTRTAVVEAMASFLESRGITPMHLFEVREVVELAAVSMAVGRLDDDGVRSLEAALLDEKGTDQVGEVAHHLHELIADMSGNRVLALFLDALTRLARLHIPTSAAEFGMTTSTAASQMRAIHRRIVDAMVAGDAEEARRLMHGHLMALTPMQH